MENQMTLTTDPNTRDLTPEHTSRHISDELQEVRAAYNYVDSVVDTADALSSVGGCAWHGWALREAFLAGCSHTRYGNRTPAPIPLSDPRDLIQRLADALERLDNHCSDELFDLLDEARAYLAQLAPAGPAVPDGREPTDEELANTYWKAWHEYHDRTNSVLHAAGLRAVLARWGSHTPAPIPQRVSDD